MNLQDLVIILVVMVIGLALWLVFNKERPGRYRQKPFLTGTEREFFYRLRRALPECIVCPQVPINSLMEAQGTGRQRLRAQELITGDRALYAVFDQAMNLISVVELDRHAKPTSSTKARDKRLETAGIRIIRFSMRNFPSEAAIHAEVFARGAISAPLATQTGGPADIEFQRVGGGWKETINVRD